jgi:hypothetical protein
MREPRFAVSFSVQLNWQEKSGALQRVSARCVDLSSEGMKVEVRDRLAPGTTVLVASNEFGRMGNTLVRYCRRDKMHFMAGLRFGTAFSLSSPGRQKTLESILHKAEPAPDIQA